MLGAPGSSVMRPVVHTLRSSHYATELSFEDMRVPETNVLGEVNRGFAIANDRLTRQRIPYAAACISVARSLATRFGCSTPNSGRLASSACAWPGRSATASSKPTNTIGCRQDRGRERRRRTWEVEHQGP